MFDTNERVDAESLSTILCCYTFGFVLFDPNSQSPCFLHTSYLNLMLSSAMYIIIINTLCSKISITSIFPLAVSSYFPPKRELVNIIYPRS